MLKINLNLSNENLWKEEMRGAYTDTHKLSAYLKEDLPKIDYPLFIPRPLALKIKTSGINSPLWNQFVPHRDENCSTGLYDPIGDRVHQKANQIIHRYENRALLLPTKVCPVSCRYCFRKNEISSSEEELFKPHWEKSLHYLRIHEEIDEVILSGGDPFILDNEKLANLLESIASIQHIKTVRFHTRVPIVLPSRLNKGLETILKNLHKQFENAILVIHANHSDELDQDVKKFIDKISLFKLTLLGQAVLLKDVNNDAHTLKDLFTKMHSLGIRPYYLHHPDQVKGGMHFYLPLEEGRILYSKLRNITSSWLLPHYVIDIPGGEGKVNAFNPEAFHFSGRLINRKGEIVSLSSTQGH